ncbi:MAG: response regulator transcription factor [Syntrophaceae bacterium]|nr:response regulator transcription factor [Syntrophaceae bacterium]
MASITEQSEKKHNLKTLLVEDNPSFRKLLKRILHEYFPLMVIEEAGNGREALQKVDSFCPDLILLDIRLPDESGLELTQKIKKECPNIIIIILTSYDLPEYREAAIQKGADAFMTKGSTTEEEIVALVKSHAQRMPS